MGLSKENLNESNLACTSGDDHNSSYVVHGSAGAARHGPVVARAVGVPTTYIGLHVALVYAGALAASLAAGAAVARFGAILINQAGLTLCAPSGALPTSPMSFSIF